jgi:hypothetical protein
LSPSAACHHQQQLITISSSVSPSAGVMMGIFPFVVVVYGDGPLPRLNVDHKGISISGLSSGADFAAQFAVAYSKSILGVGVFAGQPFHCAVTRFPNDTLLPASPQVPVCEGCPPNTTIKYDHCKTNSTTHGLVDVKMLAAAARRLSASGAIDDVNNLETTKVFTYAGTEDGSWLATVKNRDFFAEFAPPENILWNFSIPSGHCWPQDDDKGLNPKCGKGPLGWPIENCHFDGPGTLLQHVYGDLKGKLKPPADRQVAESLTYFDQAPFRGSNPSKVGLSEEGMVYVPQSCASGALCALHVSLHGCTPNPDRASHYLSFDRWAETNDIVVLWPHQGRHGGANATKEEKGSCWDGYGQSGAAYDTREGAQMQAIRAMIEAISGARL